MNLFVSKKKNSFDIVLLICVFLLVLIGVVFVYSASSYNAEINYGDKFYFMKKQIIGAIIGSIFLFILLFVDVEKIKKIKYIVLIISLVLLLLVFIPGIGVANYGANRWINLGFFTIQASEIAKFGFIFFSASIMTEQKQDPKSFKYLIPTLVSGGLVCLLIILEPNMSITMCVGLSMLVMMFVGGASLKNFLVILIPAVLIVPALIVIEPYRLQRLSAFLDPWSSPLEEGFQLIQSYYSLGSGGLFGVGFGNSRQKNLFLPFSESDFIFSIIGEELGFVASLLVILIYVIIIFRGYRIAFFSNSRFKCYLSAGITSIIAIQFVINIAVVTGAIPPTGLPLPFISAGSSALIVFMSSIGVLLSCSRKKHTYEKI